MIDDFQMVDEIHCGYGIQESKVQVRIFPQEPGHVGHPGRVDPQRDFIPGLDRFGHPGGHPVGQLLARKRHNDHQRSCPLTKPRSAVGVNGLPDKGLPTELPRLWYFLIFS